MSMPFYVSPDQMMKDRAEFARKGIARGRSAITARYHDGIVFLAGNPSHTLHKVSEIHDRIGFAAVGRYHEFENLRVAGIRYADLRGYAYDRADVSARALANSYAQLLGTAFSAGAEKPYEVELVVAEVGDADPDTAVAQGGDHADRLYRINFDGSVSDEGPFAVIGGHPGAVQDVLRTRLDPTAPLAMVVSTAMDALRRGGSPELGPADVEVAVLDRTRIPSRKFVRLDVAQVAGLLGKES
ncbi:proteasome subunit alpha [Propionibacterium freudenreichii]|uniref:proteasome subunit alpha n=1 Tax=Propionibacterium freudenreichii TaxID=1744 RepID=UPI00254C4270|nr:proteasome subunit alpha [Propionibacterium freudenreichii]MDK9670040.1 proteasome subunit alpha [Propionibacterium freudenreichii]